MFLASAETEKGYMMRHINFRYNVENVIWVGYHSIIAIYWEK